MAAIYTPPEQTDSNLLQYLSRIWTVLMTPPWYDKSINRLRQSALIESGTVTTVTTVTTVITLSNIGMIDNYQAKLPVINQNITAWAVSHRALIT